MHQTGAFPWGKVQGCVQCSNLFKENLLSSPVKKMNTNSIKGQITPWLEHQYKQQYLRYPLRCFTFNSGPCSQFPRSLLTLLKTPFAAGVFLVQSSKKGGSGFPRGGENFASARKGKLGDSSGEEHGSGPQEAVCSLCSLQLEMGDVWSSIFCHERATTSYHSHKFCPSTVQCQVHFIPLPFTYSEKHLAVAEELLKETSLCFEVLR